MRRYDRREDRFSSRVLMNFAATGLPQTFAFRAAAEGVTEILLYEEIGDWGVTAEDFVLALAKVGDGPINVRINSPGGDITEGYTIYNALKARTTPVIVTVDGLAASAASFIAMAGFPLRMAETSMMMIHKGWGFTIGNDDDHLETALILGKMDGQIADIYAKKSGKSQAEMRAVMKASTWFTSTECKDAGLCDEVIVYPSLAASAGLQAMAYAGRPAAGKLITTLRNVLPAYDPDGDGDNDAEEALGLINSAIVLLTEAGAALSGSEDDTTEGADPAVPVIPGVAAVAEPVAEPALNLAALHRRLRLAEAEAA